MKTEQKKWFIEMGLNLFEQGFDDIIKELYYNSQREIKHRKVENSNADRRERINNRKHRYSVSRHEDCPRPADTEPNQKLGSPYSKKEIGGKGE